MLTFPTALFAPVGLTVRRQGGAFSGGQSVSGIGQSAMTSGGHLWVVDFSKVAVWDVRRFKIWESFCSASDNGASPFVVPLCNRRVQPFTTPKKDPGTGNSDSSTFSDGALWGSGILTAAIIGSAALRATSAHISCIGGVDLTGGEYFTGWHVTVGQRLYQVKTAAKREDGTFDITFRPPLREATPDGFNLDFDDPRCHMQVSPNSDPSATLDMYKRGSAQVSFIESFRPATDD